VNYSDDVDSVRVDIWKQSGKWYETVALKWDRYSSKDENGKIVELINDTFRRCMKEQYPGNWKGMRAICLEPYHENSHPISIDL
jgi:hypothetical protein